MMKFRVWDKKTKYLDYRVRVTSTDKYEKVEVLDAFTDWRKLKEGDYVLMRSLGLKDKHGREIYEGDILTDEGYWDEDRWEYAEICFDHTDYSYNIVWSKSDILYPLCRCEDYAVAGNIYENKELLDNKE